MCNCSETTLTGESRFHLSTPPGDLNLWPLWREANRVVHWTSETWWESCEIAGSPQGSPPAADSVGCEARRETCSECETGTGKLCEIKRDCHIVGTRASDSLGRSPVDDQSRRGHQCSETTLTGESRFHLVPPQGIWTCDPCGGKQTGSPLDQWDMVGIMWDCRLSTYIYLTSDFLLFLNTCYRIEFSKDSLKLRTVHNFQPNCLEAKTEGRDGGGHALLLPLLPLPLGHHHRPLIQLLSRRAGGNTSQLPLWSSENNVVFFCLTTGNRI